jgi:hypothetical protein
MIADWRKKARGMSGSNKKNAKKLLGETGQGMEE